MNPLKKAIEDSVEKFVTGEQTLVESQQHLLSVLVEMIDGMKCEVPQKPKPVLDLTDEYLDGVFLHIGRTNYNKALDDIIALIKEAIV